MLQWLAGLALAGVVALLWLPLVSELICLVKRGKPRTGGKDPSPSVPRLLFLVPAHDEEVLIGDCVRSLVGMNYPVGSRRIVVIADNCSDSTASISRQLGAETMERDDRVFPGKPRGIAWALAQIDLREWDACIIIDADTTVAPDFASSLASLAPLNDLVFQANFLVVNEFESWLTRLGGLLSRCRYEVTYPIKQRAGLNCPVTGNGMGFGTNLLMKNGWSAFSITEDSELYASYTAAGVPIRHAASANLFSQEARSLGQGATQRRRWLAGRIGVIRAWGGRILRSPNIGWHQKLDAFVELGLSSPVIHLIAALAVAVLGLVLLPGKTGVLIASSAALSVSAIALTTLIVIVRHPQPWRTLSAFLMLPAYAAWRLVVVLSTLVTLGDTTWRKTARTAPV